MRVLRSLSIVYLLMSAMAAAQPADVTPGGSEATTADSAPKPLKLPAQPMGTHLDAYDAVHEGNRLLRAGEPENALPLYEHAEQLKPDAREIAFAEGLSHYALGDYEQARESFQRASLGKADKLADDALYSEGATYHAEALAAKDNPQLALSDLENAMQRYQSVLQHRPDDQIARDANYKAAHAWRQIKQMMQQQQQQQSGDKQNDDQEQQEQQQQQQQGEQKQDEQEDQQQQQKSDRDQDQNQEQQQQDQQQQNESQAEPDQQQQNQQQNDQQQQDAQAEQRDSTEQQQAQASQQAQDVSREQAERKLREMIQAQRQRQKNRRSQRALVPVRRTDKDW